MIILLNSENYYFFKSKYIYFGNAFLLAITFFVVKKGMKDVVVERKQAALENQQNEGEDEQPKVTAKVLVK